MSKKMAMTVKKSQKRGNAGVRIQDSELILEGRKSIQKGFSEEPLMRSPLTRQLYATLANRDSVVKLPIAKRSYSGSIFNLKGKAERLGGELKYSHNAKEKVLYAWLVPHVHTPASL